MPLLQKNKHSYQLNLNRILVESQGFADRDHVLVIPGASSGELVVRRTGAKVQHRPRSQSRVTEKTFIHAPSPSPSPSVPSPSPVASVPPVQEYARTSPGPGLVNAVRKARSHIDRIESWSKGRPMPINYWVGEFGPEQVAAWREHKLIVARDGMPNLYYLNPKAVEKVERNEREMGL